MKNTPAKSTMDLPQIPYLWGQLNLQSDISSDVEKAWKEKVRFLDEVSQQNNVVIFVLNPFSNRYLYMSDRLKVLSGLEAASYTAENGFEFGFSRANPAQLDGLVKFHHIATDCYANNDPAYCKNVVLCLSFLYRNGNDEYVQVLQRTMILETDDAGRPALFISFGHYVGHIKKPGSMDFVVSGTDGITIYGYDEDKKCITEPKTFSEQEKKIVALLAQGDDTKTIAEKLFISPHTVDTHRRNLIKKTSCIDTTGVVAFARLINLI